MGRWFLVEGRKIAYRLLHLCLGRYLIEQFVAWGASGEALKSCLATSL